MTAILAVDTNNDQPLDVEGSHHWLYYVRSDLLWAVTCPGTRVKQTHDVVRHKSLEGAPGRTESEPGCMMVQ